MPSLNRLDESSVRTLRGEVARCASALAEHALPLLEGVRRLASLRFDAADRDDDPDFAIFVVVDSETDHLPPEAARPSCSPAWLEQCDRELAEVERIYGPSINTACERLVVRFGAAA